MYADQDQNCILEVEECVNLKFQPPPYTTPLPLDLDITSSSQPVDKYTLIDGIPLGSLQYDNSVPINESGRVPVKSSTVNATPFEQVGTPKISSRIMSVIRLLFFWSRRRGQFSQQDEEEYAIKPNRYTLIIPLERDDLPVFNLEAQLGEERSSSTRIIHFRCTAMPAGKFREIQLFVRLSDSGSSNLTSIATGRKNEKKPKIVEFSPHDTKLLKSVEVEHGHAQEMSASLGGNALGASGGAALTKTHELHYKQWEGAEVVGAYKLKDMSDVHWTWTAAKIPGAVLKGTCDFWVEVENVKETVKAGFRVVCKMERGITNILQGDMEAPKKQKPRVEHVVTKLYLNRQE